MLYDSVDINNTYRAWVPGHMSLFLALGTLGGKKKKKGSGLQAHPQLQASSLPAWTT